MSIPSINPLSQKLQDFLITELTAKVNYIDSNLVYYIYSNINVEI